MFLVTKFKHRVRLTSPAVSLVKLNFLCIFVLKVLTLDYDFIFTHYNALNGQMHKIYSLLIENITCQIKKTDMMWCDFYTQTPSAQPEQAPGSVPPFHLSDKNKITEHQQTVVYFFYRQNILLHNNAL